MSRHKLARGISTTAVTLSVVAGTALITDPLHPTRSTSTHQHAAAPEVSVRTSAARTREARRLYLAIDAKQRYLALEFGPELLIAHLSDDRRLKDARPRIFDARGNVYVAKDGTLAKTGKRVDEGRVARKLQRHFRGASRRLFSISDETKKSLRMARTLRLPDEPLHVMMMQAYTRYQFFHKVDLSEPITNEGVQPKDTWKKLVKSIKIFIPAHPGSYLHRLWHVLTGR